MFSSSVELFIILDSCFGIGPNAKYKFKLHPRITLALGVHN